MAPWPTLRQSLVAALVFLSVAVSLVYFPITQYDLFDPATGGKEGDVAQYVRMSEGAPLTSIPKPYRYRVLTPFLARHVPFLPAGMSQFYEIDADKVLKFRFGVVNLIGLAGTASLLFLILRTFEFSPLESLAGGLLFLTSFHVVTYGGVPLVDPWGYLCLAAGVLALLRRQWLALAAAMLVGMLAKETTALLAVYALLMPWPWRERARALAACLPGLLLYLVFRFVLYPTDVGFEYGLGAAVQGILKSLVPSSMWAYIAFDGGMAFGAVWLLAFLGWREARRSGQRLLYRLGWLVPLVMLVPFAIGSNIGRIWFLAFPVMIPLALTGLRPLLAGNVPGRSGPPVAS